MRNPVPNYFNNRVREQALTSLILDTGQLLDVDRFISDAASTLGALEGDDASELVRNLIDRRPSEVAAAKALDVEDDFIEWVYCDDPNCVKCSPPADNHDDHAMR